MDLLQLHYFRTVARLEHVTRAAEELRVAQPSLSKAISRLEAELGVPLFDRRGRRVRLNRFGKAFLLRVGRIFAELEDGQRELADMAGPERGTVAVAATTVRTLTGVLGAFLRDHPRVDFHLYGASTPEMRERLAQGEVDFCVASSPMEGPDFRSASLFTEEVLLAVPPGHRLAGRRSVALAETDGEAFVSARAGYWLRELSDEAFRRAGIAPDVVCEADEPGAIRGLVGAGLGMALLPAGSRRDGPGSDVAWLSVKWPACRRTVSLVWRDDRYLSAAARRFREFSLGYFARSPERAGGEGGHEHTRSGGEESPPRPDP